MNKAIQFFDEDNVFFRIEEDGKVFVYVQERPKFIGVLSFNHKTNVASYTRLGHYSKNYVRKYQSWGLSKGLIDKLADTPEGEDFIVIFIDRDNNIEYKLTAKQITRYPSGKLHEEFEQQYFVPLLNWETRRK